MLILGFANKRVKVEKTRIFYGHADRERLVTQFPSREKRVWTVGQI